MTKPEAPIGLGARALALWTDITAAYQLRIDEVYLLEAACREVDLIERIEAELRLAQWVVRGAYGQRVINPLLPEVRQHRTTLAGLLRQMKLPDEGGRRSATDATTAARKAANARWGNNGA